MNPVDRAVTFFNPSAGLARLDARQAIMAQQAREQRMALVHQEIQRGEQQQEIIDRGTGLHQRLFDVGLYDRDFDPRSLLNGNPNEDVMAVIENARRLVRDAMMNDPVAINAREVVSDAVVGTGIQPQADSKATNPDRKEAIDSRAMERFYEHYESTSIDVNGQFDWYGLQFMGEMTKAQDGEVLWLKVWNDKRDVDRKGLKHPLQYDLREGDWLDWTLKSYTDPNGKIWPVIGGIEIDPISKWRRAYWIFTEDPSKGVSKSVRVDARYVIHDANISRVGQVRGWSIFAPVIPVLRQLKDLMASGQNRAKADASLHAIIEVPNGSRPGDTNMADPYDGSFRYGGGSTSSGLRGDGAGLPVSSGGSPVEWLTPGMITRVKEGTKVHTITPQPSQVFEPVNVNAFRRVAMAAGQTYEAISLDYSKVSFISGRMAKGPVNRRNQRKQWNWLAVVGSNAWFDFVTGCYTMKSWGKEGYFGPNELGPRDVTWTMPTPDSADPEGEAKVEKMIMMMGLEEPGEMIKRRGKDPRQHFRAMARTLKMASDEGIDFYDFLFNPTGGKVEKDTAETSTVRAAGGEEDNQDPQDPQGDNNDRSQVQD